MKESWGRFTVRGSAEVEARISALVEKVGAVVKSMLPADMYRALILIGGYGRGEGGVELRDGVESPHNNLDFLLVTEALDTADSSKLQRDLDKALASLEKIHDLGLDMSILPSSKLRNSPCLVMWYDMRFGHKTIIGDPNFVPSLTRYSVDRILPSDIVWLLVNRGSQLLVGDLLFARGELNEEERRYIVKLTMKAIIGYGDALLFFLGDYHWSYQEKARRMRERPDVSSPFKKWYAEAVEFRFEPDYGPYLDRDLVQWMDAIRGPLEQAHMKSEMLRMGASDWTWEQYPSVSLRHNLWAAPFSPRATAKKLLNLLRSTSPPSNMRGLERLACRAAGRRGMLPACYPAVVYKLESDGIRCWTQQALDAPDTSLEALQRSFLSSWAELVYPDFFKAVEQFDLFPKSKEPLT